MQAYRADIDGLRTVAVAPVVLYHAGAPGFSGGFIGVDVFFVISGFLITSILYADMNAGRYSLIGFYERRARRILPALMTVIVASAAAGAVVMMPEGFEGFAKSAVAATLFASNFWFWQAADNYFAPASDFMPLLHTWSLAVEEQFYIVFPPLLWLLVRRGRGVMMAALVAATALSFVVAVASVRYAPGSAFYLAPARAWELGIGALLALSLGGGGGGGGSGGGGWAMRTPPDWLREAAAALGLAAILACVFLYDGRTPFPGVAALAPCLGAAALIWAGGHGPTLAGRILSLRPVVFVGLISYSLYLWHWPIFAFLRLRIGEVEMPPAMQIGAIAASCVAGWLSWRFVEAPFRRRPPNGFGRGAIFAVSGGAMALVLLGAAAIWATGGAPQRISPAALAADAATRDINPLRAACMDRPATEGVCTLVPGEATVFLWGDSHADAMAPGVAAAAEAAGLGARYAAKTACPPLLGLDRPDRGPRHDCAGFNEGVLAALNAAPSVEVVVLAARWALMAEGVRAPGEAGRAARLAPPGAAGDPAANFAAFEAGLARTVAAIRAGGRDVILIGSAPEIGWNVPERLVAALRWGDAPPPAPTAADALARDARARAAMEALAAADPGVSYIPLTERLCAPDCRIADGDAPLYFDDDHLSRSGAVSVLAPLLAPALSARGGGR